MKLVIILLQSLSSEFKNYLSTSTEQMQYTIIKFLKDNSRKTPKKDLLNCIENIINFENRGNSIEKDYNTNSALATKQYWDPSMCAKHMWNETNPWKSNYINFNIL